MRNFLLLVCLIFTLAATTQQISAQCPAGEVLVTVEILTDNYPTETGYELTNFITGETFISIMPGAYTATGTTYTEEVCVPSSATLSFVITDAYGDGICCDYGNGSYTVSADGDAIVTGGAFGDIAEHVFAANPVAKDLIVGQITGPITYSLAGAKLIEGTIINLGTDVVTSFDLNYQVGDGEIVTQEGISTTINPGASYNFVHAQPWLASFGGHDVSVWASNINGGVDDNPDNDMNTKFVFAAFELSERMALLEHFTQASCGPCASQNPILEGVLVNSINVNRVAPIWYHTSWPGFDPMYNENSADPDARVSYYGISGVPSSIGDGGTYNGPPSGFTTGLIDQLTADPATAGIQVTESTMGNDVMIDVTVTSLVDMAPGNYRVHIVLTEELVTYPTPPGSNGETAFYYVQRKMLPSANGTTMEPLMAGETLEVGESWTVPSYVNADDLRTIVFIQNNTTGEVLQAFKAPDVTGTNFASTGTQSILSTAVNPACGDSSNGSIELSLVDGADELVYYQWSDGSSESSLGDLAAGFYSVNIYDLATDELLTNEIIEVPTAESFEFTLSTIDPTETSLGAASVSLPGSGYTVAWSNGSTATTATDLPCGEHSVVVTDEAGCEVTEVFTLCAVGINDVAATTISCYPNPANTQAFVTLNNISSDMVLNVVDVSGRIVLNQAVAAGSSRIAVQTAHLPNGTYFCNLTSNNTTISTQKLVVLH